eukprot:7821371-Prorocentrum_lima.AAC.1
MKVTGSPRVCTWLPFQSSCGKERGGGQVLAWGGHLLHLCAGFGANKPSYRNETSTGACPTTLP